jgi:hypothetical protein
MTRKAETNFYEYCGKIEAMEHMHIKLESTTKMIFKK